MKEQLYRMIFRSPQARERWEALRREGAPRWRALAALPLGAREEGRPLPAQESESARSHREPPRALARRMAPFDVVSFDVFDTLLLRDVDRPEEVFSFVGAKLGYPDFRRLRVEAECRAREKKSRVPGAGEVTLSEIWQELERMTALPPAEGMAAEREAEAALCRANPYFLPVVAELRRMGKELVLLSDMYLPGEFLQQLVEQAGFGRFSRCLVSGEAGVSKGKGGLFRCLREAYPPGTAFAHVGDHPLSDGARAQEQGFVPFPYENVHRAGGPFRAKDLSPLVGSVYRALVNRKLHNGRWEFSRAYEYGFVYGGLFALGYCRFIREYAQRKGVDRLLFLSRDGAVLRKLYQRLYPEDPRPVYAYWSRRAAMKVCAGLFPEDFFRRFLSHKIDGRRTLGEALHSMELEALLPGLCRSLKLGPAAPLTHKTARAVQDYLTEAWDQVLAVYAPQREAAGAYYKKLLKGCKRAAAVDIGWAGTGAVSLSFAAQKLWGLPCRISGLLAGTNAQSTPEWDSAEPLLLTGQLESYLFSSRENRDLWKRHDPRLGHNLFWELLLGAEEGSLVGFYPAPEEGYRLEFSPAPHGEAVGDIHRGLLDFAREFVDTEKRLGLSLPISGRDAYAPMLEVFSGKNAPYRREWEAFLDEPGIG